MRQSRRDGLAISGVPDAGAPVGRRRRYAISVRTESRQPDVAGVQKRTRDEVAGSPIPHARFAVSRSRDHALSVRAKLRELHSGIVLQLRQCPTGAGIQDPCGSIKGSGDE